MVRRVARAVLVALAAAIPLAAPPLAGRGEAPDEVPVLAVIVNPKNSTTNLTFNQLRSYMKLERQFWPDKERCALLLRPSNSPEMKILLEQVYRMSADELRKYWVGKVFRGEIPARPAVVPTAAAAGTRVRKVPAALTVVLSDQMPEGVRALTIDGKKPGDPGYPLVGTESIGAPSGQP